MKPIHDCPVCPSLRTPRPGRASKTPSTRPPLEHLRKCVHIKNLILSLCDKILDPWLSKNRMIWCLDNLKHFENECHCFVYYSYPMWFRTSRAYGKNRGSPSESNLEQNERNRSKKKLLEKKKAGTICTLLNLNWYKDSAINIEGILTASTSSQVKLVCSPGPFFLCFPQKSLVQKSEEKMENIPLKHDKQLVFKYFPKFSCWHFSFVLFFTNPCAIKDMWIRDLWNTCEQEEFPIHSLPWIHDPGLPIPNRRPWSGSPMTSALLNPPPHATWPSVHTAMLLSRKPIPSCCLALHSPVRLRSPQLTLAAFHALEHAVPGNTCLPWVPGHPLRWWRTLNAKELLLDALSVFGAWPQAFPGEFNEEQKLICSLRKADVGPFSPGMSGWLIPVVTAQPQTKGSS